MDRQMDTVGVEEGWNGRKKRRGEGENGQVREYQEQQLKYGNLIQYKLPKIQTYVKVI